MSVFSGYDKVISNIPGTSIHIYSILVSLAVLVAFFSSWFKMYRRNIPTKTIEGAVLVIVPVGILGARLWYVLNHINIVKSPIDVIAVWQGGIAIQGGVLAGLIVGLIIFYRASLKYKISMWVYLDCILPNILLAQAIGRWGNFFNQEVLGLDVGHSFKWLPSWINNHLHYSTDHVEVYRHPLFLYESITSLFGWIILTFVVPKLGFLFSKKPWKLESQKFQPLWKQDPFVWSDILIFWRIIKKLFSYQKWKKTCWEQAYFDFQPEEIFIKNTYTKPFKAIKINQNQNFFKRFGISCKNFFRKKTNKFYQDASLLNKSYNPNNYKLTYAGVSGSLYLLFYGVVRAIMEPFRDPIDIMMIANVRTSILVSIIWIILGIILVIFAQFIASKKFRQKGWLYERQY